MNDIKTFENEVHALDAKMGSKSKYFAAPGPLPCSSTENISFEISNWHFSWPIVCVNYSLWTLG
jgi:hypothetical protein